MISGLHKNVAYKLYPYKNTYINRISLLNNPQGLICNKTHWNQTFGEAPIWILIIVPSTSAGHTLKIELAKALIASKIKFLSIKFGWIRHKVTIVE